MSLFRGFTGFEGGEQELLASFSGSGSTISIAAGEGRTGRFALHVGSTASGGGYTQWYSSWPTAGPGTALADGATAKAVCRYFIKPLVHSSVADLVHGGFDSSIVRCVLVTNAAGQFACKVAGSVGTYSTAALALNTWYEVELELTILNVPASANYTKTGTITVRTEAGTLVETVTHVVTDTNGPVIAVPCMGNNSGPVATRSFMYDDWVWVAGDGADLASVVLPSAKRVSPVMVTGDGASAAWTGSWKDVREMPRDTFLSTAEISTATLDATHTFTHRTAADLGISGIAGTMIVAMMKAASIGQEAIVWNGVETLVPTGGNVQTSYAITGSNLPVVFDWTALTEGQFNAAEFGVRNKRGVSVQATKVYAQVLHSGTGVVVDEDADQEDSYQHAVGSYTGTGALQTITLGWRPQAVLIHRAMTGGALGGPDMFWTKHSPGTGSIGGGQWKYNMIWPTDTGFELSAYTGANQSGTTYVYLAIRDGGVRPSGKFFRTGGYTGNGQDGRLIEIDPDGWEPDIVFVTGSSQPAWRNPDHVGDQSARIGNSAVASNLIQAMQPTGFEIGSDGAVNTNHTWYTWMAWRFGTGTEAALLEAGVKAGKYIGPGTGTINGFAFTPAWVLGDTDDGGIDAFLRTPVHTGSNSDFWNSVSTSTAGITGFTADGFTYGTNLDNVTGQTYLALVQTITIPALVEVPEVEFPSADVSIGLTWVEFTDRAGTLHVSSKIDLPDPATYYGGYKEPRVISWGQIVRALSDRAGQYEGGEFSWVWSDTDRAIRNLLGAESTKVFLNRPVTVRMIDDVNRRVQATPRTMWKGVVRNYKPLSPLHFMVKVNESLAGLFSSENTKAQIPRRLVLRADFPDCPTNVINQPVPIIYGNVADTVGTASPPALTGTASRGAFLDGGYWVAGFGNLTSDAAVPTGVVAAAAAGGTLPADTYGIVVTSVDASGRESDPAPFYYDQQGQQVFAPGVPTVTVDGTQKIQVSWAAAAGATAYRVYIAYYYYGARFTQFIQTAGTSVEFTTGPDRAGAGSLTPGASQIQWGQFWYYRVSAVAADGETAMTYPEVTGMNRGYRRPIRIEWQPVVGATEYRVYRRAAGGTWDRRWTVPASQTFFDDDQLDTGATFINGAPTSSGVVPVTWVGMRADLFGIPWYAFLVAGHAVKEITDVFQGGQKVDSGTFGVTWAVPGKTGFSTYFGATPYVDINGNRYTLLYVRGPDGDAAANDAARKITLNVQGIEDVGDGSGTLITNLHLQYRHAVVNWILQDYRSGAWLAAPVFEDDPDLAKVDEDSFQAAADVAAQRISGGYTGAFIIGSGGEILTVRDLVARFNISADVDSGFNRKSQFFISMADEAIGVIDTAAGVVDVTDVIAGSFDVEDQSGEVFNRIPFTYARDYTGQRESGWQVEDERTDASSIEDLDETKSSTTVELHMHRTAAGALDVVQRRLTRSKEPPRIVKWQTSMAGLSHELGDIVLLTHYEGIGAGGWTNRPVRILRHVTDPDKFTVSIEALDMQRLFEGAFVLGDTVSLPAAWTGATTDQKRYGYLADETTGLFSNGEPGKRLR